MTFLVTTKEMHSLADEFTYALIDLNIVRLIAAITAMDRASDKMNSEEFAEFSTFVTSEILNSLPSLEAQI